MQPTDREHFETHMGVLCAGFNVPATAERLEAYWTGLSRMPISAFVRCVEHALGETGPEKIPTTSQVWSIYRQTRAVRLDSQTSRRSEPAGDPLRMFGNRMLLGFLIDPKRKMGASVHSLDELVDAKNKILDSYRAIAAEAESTGDDPPTSDEILATLRKRFDDLFEPMTAADLDALRGRHQNLRAPVAEAQAA